MWSERNCPNFKTTGSGFEPRSPRVSPTFYAWGGFKDVWEGWNATEVGGDTRWTTLVHASVLRGAIHSPIDEGAPTSPRLAELFTSFHPHIQRPKVSTLASEFSKIKLYYTVRLIAPLTIETFQNADIIGIIFSRTPLSVEYLNTIARDVFLHQNKSSRRTRTLWYTTTPLQHRFRPKTNRTTTIIVGVQEMPRPGDGKTTDAWQTRQPHTIAFEQIWVYTRAPGLSFTVEIASDLAAFSARAAASSRREISTCRRKFAGPYNFA